MIKAEYSDKNVVVDILTRSFDTNKSINFVVKQDKNRVNRIKELMSYSFELCFLFGEVFLSSEKNACALVLFPDKKKTTIKTILWSVRLIYKSIGIMNLWKVLKRESKVKKIHTKEPMYYLWFGCVDPKHQNKGVGTKLMHDLVQDSVSKERSLYFETSTIKNLPAYQKYGFQIYQQLGLGYKLYFVKRPYKYKKLIQPE